MLMELKRLWTKFLKEDYTIYLKSDRISPPSCLSKFKLLCNYRSLNGLSDVVAGSGANDQRGVAKKVSKRKVKRKRTKSAAQFEIDGTPLEPLGDME